ncbi:MAG: AAA family ATPase [Ferruginibacter sp.]
MKTTAQLLVIAGPNGAGKSTFSKDLSPLGAFIFDPDKERAIIESKYLNLPRESIEYAFQQRYQDCIELAIRKKRDFVLETNFRDHALLETAEWFKANGYLINMIYFVLSNIPESMDRVTHRVNNGGHYVDDESIRYNYQEGLDNLEYFSDRFDNLEVIDASGSYFQLRSVLSIQQQQCLYLNTDLPKGAEQVITRIADRYRDNSRDNDNDEEQGWNYTLGR